MSRSRYVVQLTDAERSTLMLWLDDPALPYRHRNRIRVLLRSAAGETDSAIAEALNTSLTTIGLIRRNFVLGGIEAAVDRT